VIILTNFTSNQNFIQWSPLGKRKNDSYKFKISRSTFLQFQPAVILSLLLREARSLLAATQRQEKSMREGLESDIRELQLKLHKAEVGKKYVWF
jgi:hypothetical protein